MDAMMTPIDMPLEDVIKMKKEENKEKKNKLMIVVKKEIQDKGQEDKGRMFYYHLLDWRDVSSLIYLTAVGFEPTPFWTVA